MGKNTKPMLTVLVESDKLQQLRDYAAAKQLSMGAIVNRLLDRLLSGELDGTIDSPSKSLENYTPGLTREAVEEMINSSRDSDSSGVSREVLEQYVETAIKAIGTADGLKQGVISHLVVKINVSTRWSIKACQELADDNQQLTVGGFFEKASLSGFLVLFSSLIVLQDIPIVSIKLVSLIAISRLARNLGRIWFVGGNNAAVLTEVCAVEGTEIMASIVDGSRD